MLLCDRLSDRLGRKPLVYAACVLMAVRLPCLGIACRALTPPPPSLPPQLVYFGFAMSPPLEVVLLLGVGFGIGNGV